MDQDVTTAANVAFASVDTGNGANELYPMDQDVTTAADVTFNSVTTTGNHQTMRLTHTQTHTC